MARSLYFITTLVLTLATTTVGHGEEVYTVTSYGAKPNGGGSPLEDSLKSAWVKACKSNGPVTINVAEGVFNEGAVTIDGTDCGNKNGITFQIIGEHLAPDYTHFGDDDCEAWVMFAHVTNVTITGGILNATGQYLWDCKKAGGHCPNGAKTLAVFNSDGVQIRGVTLYDSQMFHLAILGSSNVLMEDLTIKAAESSPNTDGIHISTSSHVNITGKTVIGTGDDCVSLGPGSKNVWIENVIAGPGHGISIGSLGRENIEDSVEHIHVQNVHLEGTQNGVRIKTFANNKATAFVNDVVFQSVTMKDVANPMIIDQYYCPDGECDNKDGQESSVQINNVKFLDISGTSKSEVALTLNCSATHKCANVTVSGVDQLTYNNVKPQASCANVANLRDDSCESVFFPGN